MLTQPTPTEIEAARKSAGLSQTAAAELVHAGLRTWQNWEAPAGSTENRKIPLASWELFLLKTSIR